VLNLTVSSLFVHMSFYLYYSVYVVQAHADSFPR